MFETMQIPVFLSKQGISGFFGLDSGTHIRLQIWYVWPPPSAYMFCPNFTKYGIATLILDGSVFHRHADGQSTATKNSTRKIRNFSEILRCIAHFLLNRLYAPKVGYSIPQSKSLHLNLRPSEPTPRICCQNASMASCKLSPNAKTMYI